MGLIFLVCRRPKYWYYAASFNFRLYLPSWRLSGSTYDQNSNYADSYTGNLRACYCHLLQRKSGERDIIRDMCDIRYHIVVFAHGWHWRSWVVPCMTYHDYLLNMNLAYIYWSDNLTYKRLKALFTIAFGPEFRQDIILDGTAQYIEQGMALLFHVSKKSHCSRIWTNGANSWMCPRSISGSPW